MANSKRHPVGDKREAENITFEAGSGNVFKDLGLSNPEFRKAKAQLAMQINAIIKGKRWNQEKAAQRLGTSQPTISLLSRGKLSSITYDKLISWLISLQQDVTISVAPARKRAHLEVELAAAV